MTHSYTLTGLDRTTTACQLKADFIQIHCPIRDREKPQQEGIYIGEGFRPIYRHHERGYRIPEDDSTRYISLRKSTSGGLIICMSGKMLGPDYPQLISAGNIDYALEMVREVATSRNCDFDVDHIRRNGEVQQLHVTEDITADLNRHQYRLMNNLVQRPSIWLTQHEANGVYWHHKKTSSGADNVTLAVYNKGAQMKNLKPNRIFMERNGIDPSNFEGKARFEARFRSMATIRKYLNLWTLGIDDVLTVPVNPIKALTEQIFDLNPRNAALSTLR